METYFGIFDEPIKIILLNFSFHLKSVVLECI